MRRQVANFLTLVSLLVGAAAATLWVRSYFAWDLFHLRTGWRWFHLGSAAGKPEAGTWLTADHDSVGGVPQHHEVLAVDDARDLMAHYQSTAPYRLHALGFEYQAMAAQNPRSHRVVVVPLWFPVLAMAAGPVLWLRRRRRERRRAGAGCCPNCGYDLRATPERCPECGTAAANPAGR